MNTHSNPIPLRLALTAIAAIAALVASPAGYAAADAKGIFTDITAASGIDFVHTFGDEEMSNLVESSGYGVCLFDADGDGRLDIYFANGSYHPEVTNLPEGAGAPADPPTNRLYRNVTAPGGPLRFEDVTAASGAGDTGFSMGCVAGDLDGDGDRDLIVTNYGPNRAYRNDGPDADGVPRFVDVTEESGLGDAAWGMGAALLDVDGDGRLDLYVGNYVRFDPDYRAFYATDRFPGPLAYPGSPDRLYRNRGGWRFEDISERAGIAEGEGRAMGIGAADLDGDGRQDVFVSNDAMANSVFLNRGDGRFEDVALLSGLAYSENGDATAAMGVDFGDLDGDGSFEIFVPDMSFSTLYRPEEGGMFHDRSRRWGLALVAAQYVGWSGHLIDYDLDGWLDLFMTTGDLHDIEPTEDLLLHNDGPDDDTGGIRLRDAATEGGPHFHELTMGRGAAVGDLDDDGAPDIVLNVLDGPAVVLRNRQATGNHWLGVRLVGPEGNPDGIGARVEVVTGGGESVRRQIREIRAGSGYLGQSDTRALFGLGDATEAARVTVRWPSGEITALEKVAADRYVSVEVAR